MEERRRVINSDLIFKTLSALGCNVLKDEPLSKHCSFKIGGKADFFIAIPNEQALLTFFNSVLANNYFILGGGTNILFSDEGYKGVVVHLTGNFGKISILGDEISCGGGALLSNVLKTALENNLSGLECAAGIPGTIGGAVCGNAGNRDKWISTVVKSIEVYKNQKKEIINKNKVQFGYRASSLENCVITKVNFSLKKHTRNDNDLQEVSENIQKRLKTQPLNIPNAGSIFKNPNGFSAGKLIEKVGLKGKRIGGAQISELHGNFIVNTDSASAKDVLALIDLIKEKVEEKFNINLETEIKIIK
ncbi:MAG: UDP-N-acetylmuramate dehydrogenase [Endomicrobium sp.]|nr:UDP-N-acetylmuramate dehydrogenase [Endomicrobium sp.]